MGNRPFAWVFIETIGKAIISFSRNRPLPKGSKILKKRLSLLILAAFCGGLFTPGSNPVFAAETEAGTQIVHEGLPYFVPDHRIRMQTTVTDDAGVDLVRCYFRATEQADFVFVGMEGGAEGVYSATLPAPSPNTESIEYLFLSVNGDGEIVKTQTFSMAVREVSPGEEGEVPEWQVAEKEGEIQVSTELAEAPEEVSGFSDSIGTDVVESNARFGVVAGGIYGASAAGAGAGAGAAAAAGAGAATGAAGLSTTAIVGIGAGVAAGVGGIAAAAGGGGGGGGGDSEAPRVLSTTPASGELVNRELRQVAVVFSEPMGPGHLVSVESSAWAHNNGTDYWADDQRTFFITRENPGPLPESGEIVFRLQGGESGFRDQAGNSLNAFTFSIRTGGDFVITW
jgi:hypothetical protein